MDDFATGELDQAQQAAANYKEACYQLTEAGNKIVAAYFQFINAHGDDAMWYEEDLNKAIREWKQITG